MKKSLFALAALTAFAGAASAQSSVTVYGILDVGFIGGNTTVNNSNPATNTPTTVRTTGNQFGESAEQTSRLGFKGSEDLGNGTQAVFTAEFGLAPADANLSGNTAATSSYGASGTGLVNRQTFVGLHKNGLGQAAIGTQYTGIHNAVNATDPGGANNMMGNVIYPYSSGTATNGQATSQGNTVAYTVRMANSLTLQSDEFAGFRVNAMAVLNNKNATQYDATHGGNTNTNGFGIGADYTYNKAYVTAQYQAFKQFTTGGSVASAQPFNQAGAGLVSLVPSVAGVAPAGTDAVPVTQGNNVQDNQTYVAATYDFGILKAYAQYVSRKASATADSNVYIKRAAEQIGVRSFITPTVEAWASAGLGRYTTFGSGQPTANFNAWQLGSNYWLSKRTNLYAIYGGTTTSTSSANATTGTVATNAGMISQSGQNYAVGVRHTF